MAACGLGSGAASAIQLLHGSPMSVDRVSQPWGPAEGVGPAAGPPARRGCRRAGCRRGRPARLSSWAPPRCSRTPRAGAALPSSPTPGARPSTSAGSRPRLGPLSQRVAEPAATGSPSRTVGRATLAASAQSRSTLAGSLAWSHARSARHTTVTSAASRASAPCRKRATSGSAAASGRSEPRCRGAAGAASPGRAGPRVSGAKAIVPGGYSRASTPKSIPARLSLRPRSPLPGLIQLVAVDRVGALRPAVQDNPGRPPELTQAVQPAEPLAEGRQRRRLGDQEVRVEVGPDFHRLGRHDEEPPVVRATDTAGPHAIQVFLQQPLAVPGAARGQSAGRRPPPSGPAGPQISGGPRQRG